MRAYYKPNSTQLLQIILEKRKIQIKHQETLN